MWPQEHLCMKVQSLTRMGPSHVQVLQTTTNSVILLQRFTFLQLEEVVNLLYLQTQCSFIKRVIHTDHLTCLHTIKCMEMTIKSLGAIQSLFTQSNAAHT